VEVKVKGEKISYLLEGATEPQHEGGTLLLSERDLVGEGETPSPKDRKELLRAWFDQLLLTSAGIKEGEHRATVYAWKKGEGQVRVTKLPPLNQEEAKQILAQWIQEATREPRWTLMPIEGVLELLAKDDASVPTDENGEKNDVQVDEENPVGSTASALENWIDTQEDGQNPSYSSRYGPLPRAVDAPVEPAWKELSRKRLGAFLDWSVKWEAAR
jgi:hypothetical protein